MKLNKPITATRRRRSHRAASSGLGAASITIRPAYADDELSVARLAALDSAAVPAAPISVAAVDGELRAALSLRNGTVIADPFFPTVHLVSLLRAHAEAPTSAPARRSRYSLKYA